MTPYVSRSAPSRELWYACRRPSSPPAGQKPPLSLLAWEVFPEGVDHERTQASLAVAGHGFSLGADPARRLRQRHVDDAGAVQYNQEECNGTCVNVQTDNQNCGSCGNTCGTGTTCRTARARARGSRFLRRPVRRVQRAALRSQLHGLHRRPGLQSATPVRDRVRRDP